MRFILPMMALLTCGAAQAQAPLTDLQLNHSECARYDAAGDRYLVTNLAERTEANDGYINIVSADGKLVANKWIAGGVNGVVLRDPLGLAIRGNRIYVLDPDTVHLFDRRSGKPIRSIVVPGAIRLNDMAFARDGTAYITDTGTATEPGALYRMHPDGKVEIFAARDAALERPNGIAVLRDGNIVYGGRGTKLTWLDRTGRKLRSIDLPGAETDGIVPLPNGDLLIAGHKDHAIYRVPAKGGAVELAYRDIPLPAAIGYDDKRHRLLVPQIPTSSLTLIDLPR